MRNAVIIDPKDNVGVAIEPIVQGSPIMYRDTDGQEICLTAATDVTIYHKFALRDIACGEKIIKYGEHIGEAACDIRVGEHVHVHNVLSVRENLDNQ